VKLLVPAGALNDLGMRARIVKYAQIVKYTLRQSMLRHWDPDEMGRTFTVMCERVSDKREFRCAGLVFCDAEKAAQPTDAMGVAGRYWPRLASAGGRTMWRCGRW
jgi:hypothetical protein